MIYGTVREVFCAAVGRGLLEGDTPLQFQYGTSLLMQHEWTVCIFMVPL